MIITIRFYDSLYPLTSQVPFLLIRHLAPAMLDMSHFQYVSRLKDASAPIFLHFILNLQFICIFADEKTINYQFLQLWTLN